MKMNLVALLAFLVQGTLSVPMVVAEELIEIKVKGTNIDRFPDYVEVVTVDPRRAAAELYANGGRNLEEDTRGNGRFRVIHHDVLHIFHPMSSCKTVLKGHSFKDGDILYKYFLNSEADEKNFVKKYDLQAVTSETQLGRSPVTLYSSNPGFYVIASGKKQFDPGSDQVSLPSANTD